MIDDDWLSPQEAWRVEVRKEFGTAQAELIEQAARLREREQETERLRLEVLETARVAKQTVQELDSSQHLIERRDVMIQTGEVEDMSPSSLLGSPGFDKGETGSSRESQDSILLEGRKATEKSDEGVHKDSSDSSLHKVAGLGTTNNRTLSQEPPQGQHINKVSAPSA